MDEEEVRATLAKNIKSLRNRRNWSQADLAEKAELSIVYLSDIERGNKWPYLSSVVKLANAFKIEVYELFKPENVIPPNTASILSSYNEEITAIFEKSLDLARKHTTQSLSAMKKQYQNL